MLKDAKKRKAIIKRKQQEAGFKRYIGNILKAQKRNNKIIRLTLESLKKQIGAKDFAMLKDICTIDIPEQKNEAGEVTQKARKEVNRGALIQEARNLIVLQREARIKAGLRKRSSGRSSERQRHKSMVEFLTRRNAVAQQEDKQS